MPLPREFVDELIDRNDIADVAGSYTQLKRAGRRLTGLCPFHNEKTPSFTVFQDTRSFYCFGCGASGDVISFIMKAENLTYIEAVKYLAQRSGMEMPENCDKCIYSGWSNFYQIYVCNAVRKEEPILFDRKQVKSTAVARSGRADNCHLHELPEHGDLIDRDVLLAEYERDERAADEHGHEFSFSFDSGGARCTEWGIVQQKLMDAPVVIPSNKEDTP